MKKLFLLGAILIQSFGFAQIGQIVITPDSAIHTSGKVPIKYDSLITSDKAIIDSLFSMINREAVPVPVPVRFVTYKNDEFAISGDEYPPIFSKYADMTPPRQAIIDAWKDNFLSITGDTLVTFSAKFGSNKFKANGTKYNFTNFNNASFLNAIKLANTIYNEDQQ